MGAIGASILILLGMNAASATVMLDRYKDTDSHTIKIEDYIKKLI